MKIKSSEKVVLEKDDVMIVLNGRRLSKDNETGILIIRKEILSKISRKEKVGEPLHYDWGTIFHSNKLKQIMQDIIDCRGCRVYFYPLEKGVKKIEAVLST